MTSIQIPTKTLAAAVSMAAKKDIRYYLNTVLIELAKDGETFVVSTNGSALFAARLPHQHTDQPRTLMIPRDVADEKEHKAAMEMGYVEHPHIPIAAPDLDDEDYESAAENAAEEVPTGRGRRKKDVSE